MDIPQDIQNFIDQYKERVKVIEEFFKQKLNDLRTDFDKLNKKMTDKRSSVTHIIKNR